MQNTECHDIKLDSYANSKFHIQQQSLYIFIRLRYNKIFGNFLPVDNMSIFFYLQSFQGNVKYIIIKTTLYTGKVE